MKQTIALLSILIVSAVAALAQNGTYMVTNLKYFKQQAAYRIADEAIVPEMTMGYRIHLGENGMPSIIAEMPEDGTCYPMTDESYASLRTMLINMMESSLSLTAPVIPHSVVITDSSITGLIAHEAFGHGVEMDMFGVDLRHRRRQKIRHETPHRILAEQPLPPHHRRRLLRTQPQRLAPALSVRENGCFWH